MACLLMGAPDSIAVPERSGFTCAVTAWIAQETDMLKQFKIIVEKHLDGYVAYPLGLKGIVVGEGDTYEAALTDVKSAIQFHIETFEQYDDFLEACENE
jgi:predicted RNase H-like HicB family nuclease